MDIINHMEIIANKYNFNKIKEKELMHNFIIKKEFVLEHAVDFIKKNHLQEEIIGFLKDLVKLEIDSYNKIEDNIKNIFSIMIIKRRAALLLLYIYIENKFLSEDIKKTKEYKFILDNIIPTLINPQYNNNEL